MKVKSKIYRLLRLENMSKAAVISYGPIIKSGLYRHMDLNNIDDYYRYVEMLLMKHQLQHFFRFFEHQKFGEYMDRLFDPLQTPADLNPTKIVNCPEGCKHYYNDEIKCIDCIEGSCFGPIEKPPDQIKNGIMTIDEIPEPILCPYCYNEGDWYKCKLDPSYKCENPCVDIKFEPLLQCIDDPCNFCKKRQGKPNDFCMNICKEKFTEFVKDPEVEP